MNVVIYHSADFDGIFCREIARHFLWDKDVLFVGWTHGDKPIDAGDLPCEGAIYVMDLAPRDVFGVLKGVPWPAELIDDRLVWIDHHATAIEQHPSSITGYRIDGVAACRLAWQWFAGWERYKSEGGLRGTDAIQWFQKHYPFPNIIDYKDRKVEEPLAVRLAGEYDVWNKRDENADTFQYALRVADLPPHIWKGFLDISVNETIQTQESQIMVACLMQGGRAAQRYAKQENETLVKTKSFHLKWEGLGFLCLNTAQCNSLTFEALDTPETGHDALLDFMWNGKMWAVSLYHAKHRTDLDLSAIAVKHGGGGHKGACGFTCNELPFPLKPA
jgi:hypothetical protein